MQNMMNDPRMADMGYAERQQAQQGDPRPGMAQPRQAQATQIPAKLVVDPSAFGGQQLQAGMAFEILGAAEVVGQSAEGIEMAFLPIKAAPIAASMKPQNDQAAQGDPRQRGLAEAAQAGAQGAPAAPGPRPGRGESMDERVEFFRNLFGRDA